MLGGALPLEMALGAPFGAGSVGEFSVTAKGLLSVITESGDTHC